MARYSKAIAALIGAVVTAAALGLLPAPWDQWVPVLVAFATAAGVYQVPNTSTPDEPRRRRV